MCRQAGTRNSWSPTLSLSLSLSALPAKFFRRVAELDPDTYSEYPPVELVTTT